MALPSETTTQTNFLKDIKILFLSIHKLFPPVFRKETLFSLPGFAVDATIVYNYF